MSYVEASGCPTVDWAFEFWIANWEQTASRMGIVATEGALRVIEHRQNGESDHSVTDQVFMTDQVLGT
jgi:hypothetical protein